MKKKSWIRRLIPWIVALGLIAALVIFVFVPIYTKSDESDLEPVVLHSNSEVERSYTLENDELVFTLDGKTTQFTLENRRTGHVWRSNPENPNDDPIALSVEKDRMRSTLLLTYATSDGTTTVFDNFGYSIENGVYDIEATDDEIRVNYVVGKLSKVFLVPEAITAARMEQFIEGMSKRERGTVLDMYQLYDPENPKDAAKIAELIETYPDLANEAVYVMRPNQKDNKKSKVEALLAEGGYNGEEYAYDMSRINGDGGLSGAVFNVTLCYRLEGSDLVLSVPYDQIRYSASYPIISITPLPYFGAASVDDQGYTIVPEGGGSVIRYNNGKNNQTAYYSNIYGWDYASVRHILINETRSIFPMFAMTSGEDAFMCLIEDGATMCGINADVSGRNNSVNTASATYTVLHSDQYDVSRKTVQRIYMFEARIPDVTVTQRYRFVDTSDYVALAGAYGDYLDERGLLPEAADPDVPMMVSMVGAIEKTVKRAGIPVEASVALTDFSQAAGIVADLSGAGLENVQLRYEGWANGGLSQRVFSSVHVEGELGGEKGLSAFLAAADDAGYDVYLDGASQFAYRSGIFQGFNYFSQAARHATRDRAKMYSFSPIFYTEEKWRDSFYLVTPAYYGRMADNFARAAQKYGANVSYRDVGYILAGDYNPADITTREESLAQQSAILGAAQDAGLRVMIRGGSLYALPHADLISDMDLTGTGYSILDEDIPFFQIAVHGRVNYTSTPLNMAGDPQTTLLRSAEYGSGLGYTVMAADADILVDTHYTQYTGASWPAVRDDCIAVMARYAEDMKGLNGLRITGHRVLDNGLTVTEYEDGTRVYVNYTEGALEADGITVETRSYRVVREGDAA